MRRTHPTNINSIKNTTTTTTTTSSSPSNNNNNNNNNNSLHPDHLSSPPPPPITPPLHGVHVCLTGFTPQRKQQLHNMVQQLGGTYAGDFNSSKTTHLIAASPTGAKYAAALKYISSSSKHENKKRSSPSSSSSSSSSACRTISIVTPSWIESCVKYNVRVSESCHELLPGKKKKNKKKTTKKKQQEEEEEDQMMKEKEKEEMSLIVQCQNLLSYMDDERRRRRQQQQQQQPQQDNDTNFKNNNNSLGLFWNCGFYFIGLNEMQQTLLNRIIRREFGVRYWTMTDDERQVDYIIVGDGDADRNNNETEEVQEEEETVWWWDKYYSTNNHDYDDGGRPFIVTPAWIISSVRLRCCQDEMDYFPSPRRSIRRRRRTISPEVGDYDDETIISKSCLFQGAIFIIDSSIDALTTTTTTNNESNNSSNNNPLWDPTHLRQLIISHGGHMLCHKTIKSLSRRPSPPPPPTANSNDDTSSSSSRRICYILTTLTTHPPSTHPLLPSLSPHCTLLPVSPLWLETTIRSSIELSPSSFPLFSPLSTPHFLSGTTIVSLTGFVGWERTAVAVSIEALGGVYSDCLKKGHVDYLICKEVPGTGPKYEKAVSWGCVTIVGLDWLIKVARGEFVDGCEEDVIVRRGKEREMTTNEGVMAVKEEVEMVRIDNDDDDDDDDDGNGDRVATVEEEEQLRKNLDDMLRRPLSLSSSQERATNYNKKKKSRQLQKRRRSSFVPPTVVKKRKRDEDHADDDNVALDERTLDDDDDETTMNDNATMMMKRRRIIGGEKKDNDKDDDDDDDDDDEKGSSMEDSQAIWFAAERATQQEHTIV